ncbi:MAG: 50S ribosomal protein L11 methyltransferase [Lachnospiraceae bacterium]|nr:50S ribosomal protein L11 methyltransferase [Lachnospiraceae bacterium]
MKWIKLSLSTTVEAEDLVTAVLDEMGIEGVQIEDKVQLSEEDKKKMFIDILPELPPDDGEAVLSFYVDCDTDIDELKKNIIENVSFYSDEYNLGTLEFEVSETEDTDWINNWKQYFKPFRADEGIVIKPTWTSVDELPDHDEKDLIIEIDPGTAFGTGAHETTKLCIKALKKHLKTGDKLLDVGCGSGILSIVGMKLGAEAAVGLDVDDNATRTSVENAGVNSIEAEYVNVDGSICKIKNNFIRFFTGNVLEDDDLCKWTGFDRFDVVVANILADIIIPLSAVTSKHMRKGALFISSGIINTKEEAVREALLKNGFEILEVIKMNDWVAFVARK